MFFSVPGFNPGYHFVFSYHVPLGPSGLSVCHSPWFSWPWQFWRVLDRYFCRTSLNLGLPDVFLITRLGVTGLGEEHTEVKCPSHLMVSGRAWHPHDITGGVNFHHLSKSVSTRFLHQKVTTFPFLYTSLFCTHTGWKWVIKSSPYSRGRV